MLSSKTKIDNGIIVRKIKAVRKEYRKGADLFHDTINDDETGSNSNRKDADDSLVTKDSQNISMLKAVSTSKADIDQPRFVREDIHYFTQVMDLVWED